MLGFALDLGGGRRRGRPRTFEGSDRVLFGIACFLLGLGSSIAIHYTRARAGIRGSLWALVGFLALFSLVWLTAPGLPDGAEKGGWAILTIGGIAVGYVVLALKGRDDATGL